MKRIKILVNGDSKHIQELLFGLGYHWGKDVNGSESSKYEIRTYPNMICLYGNSGGILGFGTSLNFFNSSLYTEYCLYDGRIIECSEVVAKNKSGDKIENYINSLSVSEMRELLSVSIEHLIDCEEAAFDDLGVLYNRHCGDYYIGKRVDDCDEDEYGSSLIVSG